MSETTTTFGELIRSGALSITDGYRAKNEELTGNGLIFLRAGHVTDAHIDFAGVERFDEKLTPKLQDKTSRVGDVIITTKGNSTGRTSFVDATMPVFVYSPHLSRWRVEDDGRIAPGFLRYWSRSPQFVNQMRGLATSTDMAPYLSLRDQQRLEITLPQLPQQQAIARVLGALDDKIEQNRRTTAKLEALARATFRAWFVDFAPVHAKAAGHPSYPGLPPAAFAALPTRLTDSPLGPIPEGWEVGPISRLANLSTEQVDPQDHAEEVFDHFSIPAFDAGRQPVREAGENIKSGKFLVPSGCVMISKLNPRIPRIWLPVASGGARPIASTEFIVLVPKGANQKPFLFGLLTQESFLNELAGHASGTSNSHQRLKPKAFMDTDVVLPPAALREWYANVAAPMLDLVQQGRDESRHLAALRDYLLPRLLSGVVRVRGNTDTGGER